jgi:hypothetical protein
MVAEAAGRAAESSAATTRAAFLRAWAEHVRETLEREANAWRPTVEHREVALDLWRRLDPLSPADRNILLRYGTDFHSWALVEKIADLALESLASRPGLARERADFACQISDLTAGSEPWKARVRGYARAARARVLQETGDPVGAQEARSEAERLWAAGEEEPGLLSEERFRTALGAVRTG